MSTDATNAPAPSPSSAAAAKRRPRRRALMRLAAAGVVVLMIAAGVPYYLHAMAHEETDDAFVEAHVVRLSPRVSGHVARVLVRDNQPVRKGDLLVEIDPADYRIALESAQAGERAAEAAVAEARARADAAQSSLAQAGADLEAQVAAHAQARAEVSGTRAAFKRDASDLVRTRDLADTGVVSPQEYDHALATRDVSKAQLSAAERQVRTQAAKIAQARAAMDTAREALRQAQAQVDAMRADLERAHAATEQARLNLSYTRVIAPCDGHAAKRTVEPGAYVQPGQALLSVVGDEVWVVANFKETQLSGMRPGQPVDIALDTYPGVRFPGHVDSIQRGTGARFSLLPPENASGNYIKVVQRVPVKIVFDKDAPLGGYLLTPGMSAVPEVDISAPGGFGKALAATTAQTER